MKITKLIAQSAVISFAAVFLLTGTSCSTSSGGGGSDSDLSSLEETVSQCLGHGYNVFGNYINAKYVSPNPIIDFSLAQKKMGYSKKKIGRTVYQTKVGSSLQTYQRNLSTTVKASYGIDKLFSLSISTTFSSELTGSNNYSYASVHTNVEQYSYSMQNVTEAGMSKLVECISPNFRTSVESYMENADFTPEKLFNEYGTHVILGGTFGGRYDYYMVTSKVKSSESYKLNAKLSTSYSSKTGEDEDKTKIAASAGVNSKNVNTSDISEYKNYAEIIGGSNAFQGDLKDADTYQKWLASVESEENWRLIGFDEGSNYNGILPVWELIKAMGSGKSGDRYYEFAAKLGKGYVEYEKAQNLKYQAAYADWTDPNNQGKQCVWGFLTQSLPNNYTSKPVIEKEVDVGNGVKATVAYYPIREDLRHSAGGNYEYIYVAYCYVYNDKIIVKDSVGKETITSLEPVNEIVVENVTQKLIEGGYEYTEKLHPDAGNGSSHGGWMLGFKRGKNGAARDVSIWNNTEERESYTYYGPGISGCDSYGAEEVGKSKEEMKGKEGQNINRYMGTSYDNMFVYYYCDK